MVARGISNVLICKKLLSSDAWKDVTKCMQILVTFSPPPECSPIFGAEWNLWRNLKCFWEKGRKARYLHHNGLQRDSREPVTVVKVARAKKEIWTCYCISPDILLISRLASADSSLYQKATAWVCNWCGFESVRCQVFIHHLIATSSCSF